MAAVPSQSAGAAPSPTPAAAQPTAAAEQTAVPERDAAPLDAAAQQLAAGRPAACLALLAALPSEQRGQLAAHRLQAVCRIQLAGGPSAAPSSAWWNVFGVERAAATRADVQRQYKRLAGLVHPDKCAAAGAAEAFRRLRDAADALLAAVDEGPQGGGGAGCAKRARTAGGSGGQGEEEDDDGWVPDGGGFPWWSAWDSPAAARGATEQATSSTQQQQQQGGSRSSTGGSASAAGDAERAEQELLQALGLEELRAEVRQRQAVVLNPPLDAQGRRLPLPQLQAALRRARTALAERATAAAAQRAAAAGGGFLPS